MTGVRAQAESMDTGKAVSRLRSLASDSARRSKTAVLRDVYVEIETAIEAGVSQAAILEELLILGLEITHPAFRSALRRLRAAHGRSDSCRGTREATTDFAPVPYPERRSFASTTTSGSLYDVEALSRLIRASSRVDSPPGIRGA
jgi:hypothetical protein